MADLGVFACYKEGTINSFIHVLIHVHVKVIMNFVSYLKLVYEEHTFVTMLYVSNEASGKPEAAGSKALHQSIFVLYHRVIRR